jgi:hypothetical protein
MKFSKELVLDLIKVNDKHIIIMKYLLILLPLAIASCTVPEPKEKLIVPHVIKSKTEVKRWDPVTQQWTPRYRYYFTDGDSMTINYQGYSEGDTVNYTYYKY